MKLYSTVRGAGQAEQIIEKSRFIAYVSPAQTKEEADAFIASIKKKHKDATHNVPAMVIGDKFQIQWASDDGEPQGTSGAPMVQMLVNEGITNVVVVVTRYFGGIKLGTGGLVRAYSSSTKEGLLASKVITKMHGQKISIETDYTGLGKIQYILGQRGLAILDSIYTDKVELEVLLPEHVIGEVMAEIREGTNGQAKMKLQEECYFANIDGEMEIFED